MSPAITKVLHAAHQDLEIFFHLRGAVPSPVFDTQLAALVLGYGNQIGYASLVQQVLGVTLAKAYTRADWRQRPMAAEWLAYAADDVRYLGEIYTQQLAALRLRGWAAALAEDFQALTEVERYRPQPQEQWRRVREQNRLRGVELAVLRALAAWREEQASQNDRPRRWILDDTVLVELARRLPETLEELRLIHGLPNTTRQRHGATLLALIAAARNEAPERWPAPPRRPRLSPKRAAEIDTLLDRVAAKANQYGIAPHHIADQREIERLLAGEDCRLLHGWRAAAVGKELAAHISAGRDS